MAETIEEYSRRLVEYQKAHNEGKRKYDELSLDDKNADHGKKLLGALFENKNQINKYQEMIDNY